MTYLTLDELSAFTGAHVRIVRRLTDTLTGELRGQLIKVFPMSDERLATAIAGRRLSVGGYLIERYTSGGVDLSAVISCERERCEGCSEVETAARPLSAWRVRYRGPRGSDRALFCQACGQLAAAGEGEYIQTAERIR